jgi:MFS family permease
MSSLAARTDDIPIDETGRAAAAPDPGAVPRLGRRFVTVWAGQTFSTVGSALSGIGIAVYVFVTTGSLAWLGALSALGALPVLMTSPFLRLTDRFDRRTVMIGADIAAAIGPTIALGIALFGEIRPWHLAVAGFAGGLGTSFQVPAYQAALPHLVDERAIDRANGLVQLGPAAALVLGPALATPLVAWWGIKAILIADLVSFLIGAGATALTPFSAVSGPVDEAVDDGSNRAALDWLRGPGRALLVLLVVMAFINLVMAFFNVAYFALAVELGGVARAGLAPAVGGAAMIVASLAVGSRGMPTHRVRVVALAVGMMAIACLVTAVRPSFGLLLVGSAIALATVPIATSAVSTIFHEHVPPNMHGRIFGVRNVIGQVLYPVGALSAGLVGTHLAAPAMAEGGSLSSSVGNLIGVGADRGPALIMLCTAFGLGLLLVPLLGNRTLGSLDESESGAVPGCSADTDTGPDRVPAARTSPPARPVFGPGHDDPGPVRSAPPTTEPATVTWV